MTYLKKKLRDVLQEREGASVNYFKLCFKYIKQFYCSISLYLALSRFILVFFGLSWSILVHISVSWSISVHLDLSRAILSFPWLSWAIHLANILATMHRSESVLHLKRTVKSPLSSHLKPFLWL